VASRSRMPLDVELDFCFAELARRPTTVQYLRATSLIADPVEHC
jgi:hypothetical protein